ncbi:MAG: DnaJ C-terminal domain-containing protein [Candidatus Shapirobacteria bacterium]
MKPDFYETLGLVKGASAADIKSAYRKKAMEFHPDRNKAPDAEEKFKEINGAYEVLSNPQKKSAYDQFGHAAFDPSSAGSNFGGHTHTQQNGPFNFTWQSNQGGGGDDFDFGGFSNPFDIFEQFFGNGAGGMGQQRSRQVPTYKIQISFLDAARGCKKEVTLDGQRRNVTIPAGVDDGQRIKFGDFILYIDVLPDKIFTREGNNLFVNQDMSLVQAILGDELSVPTLDEPLKIRIKAGTQPGTLIRLRGHGIPDVQGYGKGDLYIRLNLTIPTKITAHQKELIKELGL